MTSDALAARRGVRLPFLVAAAIAWSAAWLASTPFADWLRLGLLGRDGAQPFRVRQPPPGDGTELLEVFGGIVAAGLGGIGRLLNVLT